MGPRLVINSLWSVVVASLVREMGEMKMERLAAASTTTTDRMLGQSWSEQAKHTADILAGIQHLSSRDYAAAAQHAKDHLLAFQQQRPRMALPGFGSMDTSAALRSQLPHVPVQESSSKSDH